jgi:DNA repair protein RecO (recombination protein O)
MTKPRVYKTEGIVLKRNNLGEADNIITVYTPNLGKLKAIAKGARRLKSKLGGHLDLLTQSSLLLAQGQNLDVITQSQTVESFPLLRNDLWRTSCALYVAELVDQFTPEHVENYPVYKLLQTTLLWLCEARDKELVLRYFELHLLNYLGYKPELYQCLNCRASLTLRANLFSFSASGGGVLCANCAGKESSVCSISVDALKVMRFLLNSDHTSARKLRVKHSLSCELERLMREYIRYILEKELKTAEFMTRLRRECTITDASVYCAGYLSRSTT